MSGASEAGRPVAGTAALVPVADGGGPIRVMVVDDHRVMRSALRLVVERAADLTWVGEAGTAEEAVRGSVRMRPDVVVMDPEMPDGDGLAGIALLREKLPDVRVVILSVHGAQEDVRKAFRAGADAYVTTAAADTKLLDAIHAAVEGRGRLAPTPGAVLAQPDPPDPLAALSDREREVFLLLASGYANQEIAERLTLSPRTIETHRAHLMATLGASTRADIVRVALRSGALTPGRRPAA